MTTKAKTAPTELEPPDVHSFQIQTIKESLHFMVPPSTAQQVIDWCKAEDDPCESPFSPTEEAGAIRGKFGSLIYLLVPWDNSPYVHGLLAHEIAHVVHDMLDHRGIKEVSPYECYTHLTELFTKLLIEILQEKFPVRAKRR